MHFQFLITIVLQKLGKSNYTTAKAYRLITLLNTLKKAFKFIFAKKITYLAETHKLLFHNYFSAKQVKFTKYILYYIIKYIYSLKNKKKIASTLLLDVTGTFDNIFKDYLLYNLHTK